MQLQQKGKKGWTGATKSLDEIHSKRDTRIKAVPDFRSRSCSGMLPFPGNVFEFLESESGQIDITRDEYFDFNSPGRTSFTYSET